MYKKAKTTFPILDNYEPEMLFIELLCSDKEDNNIIIDEEPIEEPIEAMEIPLDSDRKNMKKLFMDEMLKNPSLISNMTKMVGNIDPNIIKTFANGFGNKI